MNQPGSFFWATLRSVLVHNLCSLNWTGSHREARLSLQQQGLHRSLPWEPVGMQSDAIPPLEQWHSANEQIPAHQTRTIFTC